jgi:DNA polymerase III delta prime subunit
MDTTQIVDEQVEQNKVISLYSFIQKLNEQKKKTIVNISDYPFCCPILSIPNDPENIKIFYRDYIEDSVDSSPTLLSVHKPEFQNCPEPDEIFSEWLIQGWESYRNSVSVAEMLPIVESEYKEDFDNEIQYFSDNTVRVAAYENWKEQRELWVKKQLICERTRRFFTDLYCIYMDLNRDIEAMELVVANGFIRDSNNGNIDHPVLTRRVRMSYDAVDNTIFIEDMDVESELYTAMFQLMTDINLATIKQMIDELYQNNYHPLDRNDTPEFFKVLIHQLSSNSLYVMDEIPTDWFNGNRMLIYQKPCFILRKRVDGTMKAIDRIIENVKETGEVPGPIRNIVSGGKIEILEDRDEISVEEQLAAVGGESVDIFLSKEANKEQLEIARRIERYNAVLVQGPPGTGKTHTIANLMGHFLAQGKTVLVTSHTQKALRVLKEKISHDIRHLCVSVLDDSNDDMEKSIDGISDYMSRNTSFGVKGQMEQLDIERKDIMRDLAITRKKLFSILNQENNCIVYNGEGVSPSAAAEYVRKHRSDLSYIPGEVRLYEPLPLSFIELSELYRSNESISVAEEKELSYDLLAIEKLLTPAQFSSLCDIIKSAESSIVDIKNKNAWKIKNDFHNQKIEIFMKSGSINLSYSNLEAFKQLKDYAESLDMLELWMYYAAVDGKKGGAFYRRWNILIEQINKSCVFAESIIEECFGKSIQFQTRGSDMQSALVQLQEKLKKRKKISKMDTLFNKSLSTALSAVTINGVQLQSVEDCNVAIHCLEMDDYRKQCALYWDELLAPHGLPTFLSLSDTEQEQIARKYIANIERYLNWYESIVGQLSRQKNNPFIMNRYM